MTDQPAPPLSYATGDVADSFPVMLGFIAMRLMSIYFMLSYVSSVATMLLAPAVYSDTEVWKVYLSGFVYTLPWIFAFMFAQPIARRFFAFNGLVEWVTDGKRLMAFASAALGLYFLAMGMALLVYRIALHVFNGLAQRGVNAGPIVRGGEPLDFTSLLWPLAEMALGLALFLRPVWVVRLWVKHVRMPEEIEGAKPSTEPAAPPGAQP
jgi:hypothetical protein